MTETLDDKIARLKKELHEIVHGSEYAEREPFDDFIYSESEEVDWKALEPDFTKRIVRPLSDKQRRRLTRREKLAIGLIFVSLTLSVTLTHVAASPTTLAQVQPPNESKQLSIPNNNDALPYDR